MQFGTVIVSSPKKGVNVNAGQSDLRFDYVQHAAVVFVHIICVNTRDDRIMAHLLKLRVEVTVMVDAEVMENCYMLCVTHQQCACVSVNEHFIFSVI